MIENRLKEILEPIINTAFKREIRYYTNLIKQLSDYDGFDTGGEDYADDGWVAEVSSEDLEKIIQAFKDEGWRVPQKPLDQEKVGELLEKLYYDQ